MPLDDQPAASGIWHDVRLVSGPAGAGAERLLPRTLLRALERSRGRCSRRSRSSASLSLGSS
jgi:hypothetical protein